ncbi:hypothetical protein H8K32_00655 [Undibacterium jejuense]|uniref:Uncharacterized protein n=1 Tax=Undibacterium jejuense TaxID=1344949 RepID=A0A923HDX8_9BURK|nr:hypothetical protein [Undibacterium jejuense]MBC3860598.1 hypothetical protein [Undibacterium jejuense]
MQIPLSKAIFNFAIKNFLLFGALSVAGLQSTAQAAPLLRCYATYAGETQIIEAHPSDNPYQIEPVDIGGRFKLKMEMNGEQNAINYIKIYAYFQTSHGDVPIHEASYYPPFQRRNEESVLTPFNRLYAGPLERELQYHCTLQDK